MERGNERMGFSQEIVHFSEVLEEAPSRRNGTLAKIERKKLSFNSSAEGDQSHWTFEFNWPLKKVMGSTTRKQDNANQEAKAFEIFRFYWNGADKPKEILVSRRQCARKTRLHGAGSSGPVRLLCAGACRWESGRRGRT